jgi:hypothetical protein
MIRCAVDTILIPLNLYQKLFSSIILYPPFCRNHLSYCCCPLDSLIVTDCWRIRGEFSYTPGLIQQQQ